MLWYDIYVIRKHNTMNESYICFCPVSLSLVLLLMIFFYILLSSYLSTSSFSMPVEVICFVVIIDDNNLTIFIIINFILSYCYCHLLGYSVRWFWQKRLKYILIIYPVRWKKSVDIWRNKMPKKRRK